MPQADDAERDTGTDGRDVDGCKGVKADGSPCGAPPRLVDPDTGFCASHDPEKREKMREAASRGGQTTARRLKGGTGLTDADLPPLVNHDAAETWTDAIGRAAATGRIGANAANAALRAVKEWREAHDAGRLSDRLEALTDALAEWRKTGDPEPVLELVEVDS